MNEAFPKAQELTKNSQDVSNEFKREVLRRLDILEEDIKHNNAGAIQKGWNWFKENAPWLIPTLKPVIIEIWKLIFS